MSMNSPSTLATGDAGTGSKTGSGTADVVQEHAGATVGAAKQEVGEIARSAKDHARSMLDRTTDEMRTQGRQQTDRLATTLDQASDELRRMADASDESSTLGGLVRSLSDSAHRAATRLEHGGPDVVLDDLRRMGREHPVRFLAIAAAGGFAVARALRSSDTVAMKRAVSGEDESSGRVEGPGEGRITSRAMPSPQIDAPTAGESTTGARTGPTGTPAPPVPGTAGTADPLTDDPTRRMGA